MRARLMCVGVVVVAACGGGGDGGEPDAPVCEPAAAQTCQDALEAGLLFDVDSCGNVAAEPSGGCICACAADGLGCGTFTDPLLETFGCSDTRDCLTVTTACTSDGAQTSVSLAFENTCQAAIRCVYHQYRFTVGEVLGVLTTTVPVTLEPGEGTTVRTVGFDEAAACEAFNEAEPLAEGWACALTTDPPSCLPNDGEADVVCDAT
jgi:hypothetical protein